MNQLADYSIREKVGETLGSLTYKGKKENEGKTYIVKILKSSSPTISEIARFKYEYNIIKKLNHPGIIQTYELLEHNNQLVLVLEDFSSLSLDNVLKNKEIDLKQFLRIAIQIARTLGFLHENNIIHRDVKPKNLLFNAETEEVKITNFGIANEITRENEKFNNANTIVGTLAYMSPEQTGRINRQLDYRTDIYSLGITLYELLTGQVPFLSFDPLEMIHYHLAVKAKSIKIIKPSVPKMVSNIVEKLMAKIPDERYQNCYGLVSDLKECLKGLEKHGKISTFKLGQKDISLLFTIPQILIGRKKELATLVQSYEQVTNFEVNQKVLLVTGAPGIGKSRLIQELQESIVAKRGYFITGTFNQFTREMPYSALIRAFSDLIQQILTESDKRIENLRERILYRITSNGKVITDVIPDLEHIIGKQSEIPELGSEENQNRFNYVFENFVTAISTVEQPLILFLDDLQWIDLASLSLIKVFMTSNSIKNFLIIGSYRDTEVDRSHPLSVMLDLVNKNGATTTTIHLDVLDSTHVNELISHFLRCNQKYSEPLAKLIHEKTNGNPFFINQFIKNLYDQKLLKFDPVSNWQWDIEQIQETKITDNVVKLLTRKITTLPQKIQEILTLCSCLGTKFNLEFLSHILNISVDEVLTYINYAINEGVLRFKNNFYFFQHDHIQQAIYSLVPSNLKKSFHYRIGQTWLEKTNDNKLAEEIIPIVEHLNRGKDRVKSKVEYFQLAKLNLQAGQKAKKSTAYKSAQIYFDTGIDCMKMAVANDLIEKDDAIWMEKYELSLALHTEAATTACANGDYDSMEKYSSIALRYANSFSDKVDIYLIRMLGNFAQKKIKDAMIIGLDGLKQLGITFPKNPNLLHLIVALIQLKFSLRGKKIRTLFELPKLEDPLMQAVMRLMVHVGPIGFYYNPFLTLLITIRSLKITLKYGNSEFSPQLSYSGYGGILCYTGKFDAGYEFGQLALKLLNTFKTKEQIPLIYFTVNHFINHWKKHLSTVIEPSRYAYQSALEVGDFQWAAYLAYFIIMSQLHCGINLAKLDRESMKLGETVKNINQKIQYLHLVIYHQTVHNLIGKNDNPCHLKGEIYDENQMLPVRLNENILVHMYSCKMMLICYLGNYEMYLDIVRETENKLNKALPPVHTLALFYFYDSLLYLGLYDTLSGKKKRKILKRVNRNQKKVKNWMKHCPENFEHKFYLVEAERMRISARNLEAIRLYNKAIAAAQKNKYVQEEGLANEYAAKFFLQIGEETYASIHAQTAYNCYSQWGAIAKVKQFSKKFNHLLKKMAQIHEATSFSLDTEYPVSTGSSLPTYNLQTLDITTILKAAKTISGEIVLDKLIKMMMKITLENAGAQKGFLILENEGDNKLYIEAEGAIDKEITVLKSTPLEHTMLPLSIINYVKKTKTDLIINNTLEESNFTNDIYIIKNKVKSILCGPIMDKGTLFGIIYLENNLATHAFSPENLLLLRMLSSQAAISIKNAQLYQDMEVLVEKRTNQLKETQKKLLDIAHKTGMAEIAAEVMHNIGNVLNSIKTSAQNISEDLEQSKIDLLHKTNDLVEAHMDTIGDYLTNDDKGKNILPMYKSLYNVLKMQQTEVTKEMQRVMEKIMLLDNLVKDYDKYLGNHMSFIEDVDIVDTISKLIIRNDRNSLKNKIEIIRPEKIPLVSMHTFKFEKALNHIINNAEASLSHLDYNQRKLIVDISHDNENQSIHIKVIDNGIGIKKDNLTKIFNLGFTTSEVKKGFGLHDCANTIIEMGGRIEVHSDGEGKGACFTMILPVKLLKKEVVSTNYI